jgi:hypothetical protein
MTDPLFTKQQLADYVLKCGYTANIDDFYDWYEKTEFTYMRGNRRYKITSWKADVRIKLRNGKFKAKKIEPKKILTEEEARKHAGL